MTAGISEACCGGDDAVERRPDILCNNAPLQKLGDDRTHSNVNNQLRNYEHRQREEQPRMHLEIAEKRHRHARGESSAKDR